MVWDTVRRGGAGSGATFVLDVRAFVLKTIVCLCTVRPLSVIVSLTVNRCFWASRRRPAGLSVTRTFVLLPAWIVTFSLPRTTVLMRGLVRCDFAAPARFDCWALAPSSPVRRTKSSQSSICAVRFDPGGRAQKTGTVTASPFTLGAPTFGAGGGPLEAADIVEVVVVVVEVVCDEAEEPPDIDAVLLGAAVLELVGVVAVGWGHGSFRVSGPSASEASNTGNGGSPLAVIVPVPLPEASVVTLVVAPVR